MPNVPLTVRSHWYLLLCLQTWASTDKHASRCQRRELPCIRERWALCTRTNPAAALTSLGPGAYLQLCLLKWDCNLLQHARVLIDNYLLQIWTIYTVYWLTQCKILIQMLMCPWHCIILFHAWFFSSKWIEFAVQGNGIFNGWMIYSLKLRRLLFV